MRGFYSEQYPMDHPHLGSLAAVLFSRHVDPAPCVPAGILSHMVMLWIIVVVLAAGSPTGAGGQTPAYPWAPNASCNLNPAKPAGLHPEALAAVKGLALAHRITQGINHAVERGNVHDTDGLIDGKAYTAAADISVRCLSETQIRMLLDRLADAGFAAWYRKDGQDGWNGPPHIHAVFAGCRLKPVLHLQVEDWLRGGTGLSRNEAYKFWQPSRPAREKLRELYRPYLPTPKP